MSVMIVILLEKFTSNQVLILYEVLLLGGPNVALALGTCCNMLVLSEDIPLMASKICFVWFAENPESTGSEDWTTECCHRWCFFSATVRGNPKWSSCELGWSWSCHMRLQLWCHGTQSVITMFSKKNSCWYKMYLNFL